ncbi:peroxiredoxin [Halobacteriales archaeon SW_12_69_24]|nr:MAG: peroxiredoxin [Halobacteriales archaeon SW_12_69_24]
MRICDDRRGLLRDGFHCLEHLGGVSLGVHRVYFYPRDGTPGCTQEAREFEADIESFRRTGVTVYGVSTDDVDSHRAFADEEDLSFDLLADPDGTVADAFDVELQGDFVDRITFVLADGEVHEVVDADTMNPEGHAAEVLEAVEAVAE